MRDSSAIQPSGSLASRQNLTLPKKAPSAEVDTIIVSDIHLGSKVSRVRELTKLIEEKYTAAGRYLFNRLVLLGDVFDHHDTSRLTDEHWDFLSLIKKISDPKSGVEVVWLEGNHDIASDRTAERATGKDLDVARDYEWSYGGKKFVATHGDRFDTFIEKFPLITTWSSNIYELIQRLDTGKQRVSRFIKRVSKRAYLPKTLHTDILAFARQRTADVIFCGHTHHAETITAPDGITYFNTGCWTEFPSTYITVGESGIKTHEVW